MNEIPFASPAEGKQASSCITDGSNASEKPALVVIVGNMREERMMISFSLPYPGAAASSNHGYGLTIRGGKAMMFSTKEAVAFKDEVIVLVKQALTAAQWYPAPRTVLYVTISACFPNKRHSDISNCVKFILDGIEDALNSFVEFRSGPRHNDRDWGYTVMPPVYRLGEPMIEVKVE